MVGMETMDLCAELTLRASRLLQEHRGPESSFAFWYFLPEFHRTGWAEARMLLANAPKPLLVSPLVEPGMLATWRLDVMGPGLRPASDHHAANQVEYYEAKLKAVGLDDGCSVELRTPSGELSLPVPEFRRWYHEYLFAGVSVAKTVDPRIGRLLLHPPGGGRPIGWDASLPLDDHHHR